MTLLTTLLTSHLIAANKVKAILTPNPDIKHYIALASAEPKLTGTTTTINNTPYETATVGDTVVLIDPETYSASACNALITDLTKVQAAFYRRETDFSIAKSCPALVQLLLFTHSKNSVAGVGTIKIKPTLELTVSLDDETETQLILTDQPAEHRGRWKSKAKNSSISWKQRRAPTSAQPFAFMFSPLCRLKTAN